MDSLSQGLKISGAWFLKYKFNIFQTSNKFKTMYCTLQQNLVLPVFLVIIKTALLQNWHDMVISVTEAIHKSWNWNLHRVAPKSGTYTLYTSIFSEQHVQISRNFLCILPIITMQRLMHHEDDGSRAWLGPSLAALQHVKYFQISGWCHISPY